MHFTKHRHTFLLTERNRGRHNRLLWNSRLRPSLTGRSGDWPEATTASGGSARAPRLHPLPRAACTLLFRRGIILVTPLAGLRARPFRKASRDPLSSRRAATGSFQSRNDPPQRSRAATPSGSGAACPALPPPPALSWPLAAAGGSRRRRLPALGGFPLRNPDPRPQGDGTPPLPKGLERSRPPEAAAGLARELEGPPRCWGRLRQCPNAAGAAAGGPSTTRLPLHT